MTVDRKIAWEQVQSWLNADLLSNLRWAVPLHALLSNSSELEAEEDDWLGLSDAERAVRSLTCVSSFFARRNEVFGFLFVFPLDFVLQYFRTVGPSK